MFVKRVSASTPSSPGVRDTPAIPVAALPTHGKGPLAPAPSATRSSDASTTAASSPDGRPQLGPGLEWVPVQREYTTDAAYAAFRARLIQSLSRMPDYPVEASLPYRAR